MVGKKATGALGIAVVTLVLGVGVAAAANDDGKEQQGTRVTSGQSDVVAPVTRDPDGASPVTRDPDGFVTDGKDQ